MDFRFVAYDPQTGAKLYQLPRANSVNIGDTFGTRGTLELTYSAKAVNARDLPTFLEVQAEVTFDEGHNWAPAGPSLLRLSGEHEDTDQAGMRTLRFVGREWVLGKARVGNGDLELIDGKRPFYRASPGQILRTLILEAQDRGAADGIEIGNFTAPKDSSGNAWSKVATIYYSPGLPISSVLENLVEQGMCDYRMDGRTIELFDPETTMGRDLTTGNNPVRVHGAVTEAPVKYTLEDLANSALLMGDEGFELEVDNPTAPDDYGRLEVTIEQGGVSDSGTARLMVDEALQRGSREVREITRSQSAAGAAFLPLRDYRVGDYVQVHTGGEWERYRVRELQLARDGQEWTIHTVINDRLQELLLKLAKRTSGIVNGSKGSGGDGTRPTPPEKPGIEPAAPEGLVIDQQVYLDRQGIARGQITAGWGSVTESTKGQAVEIGGYELWWRRNETQETWTRVAVTDGSTSVNHSPVVLTDTFGTAMEYQWRVRAIAQASTRPGPFSDVVTLTMTQDTEPPNTPSLPTVSTDLRIITVDVDGLDEFGEAMPVDFDHTRIYFAPAEDMVGAEQVGTLTQPGSWNSGSMTPDAPVWVAVSAVDHVGNESAMTPAQSVTPRKLVDDSSIRDELTGIDDKINDAVDDLNQAIENIVIDANGTTTYWLPTAPDETTDPKPKTGDLWFDTSTAGKNKLHRFDGASWVSAADERIDTIDQAQSDLEADVDRVRTSVDGKNAVTQSTSTPPNQYDGTKGDIWEIMSSMGSGGRSVSRWRWNGDVWVSNLIGDTVLGNVDAAKIGTGYLSADRIDSNTISADMIAVGVSGNLAVDPLFADSDLSGVRSGSSRWEWNVAGEETYMECVSGSPLSTETMRLYAKAGGPREPFPASVGIMYSVELDVSGPVAIFVSQAYRSGGTGSPAASIQTDLSIERRTVSFVIDPQADRISTANGTETLAFGLGIQVRADRGFESLDSGTVTRLYSVRISSMTSSTLIEDGAVTTDKIAAGSITSDSGVIGDFSAGSISSGTIDAARIGAKSISSSKLLVIPDSGNFAPGPGGSEDLWEVGPSNGISGTSNDPTGQQLYVTVDGSGPSSSNRTMGPRIQSIAGDRIRYKFQVFASGDPDAPLRAYFVYDDSATSWDRIYTGSESGFVEGVMEVRSDVIKNVALAFTNDSAGSQGVYFIRNFEVFKQTPATLIEDGAITTDKILANAITAGKIAALAIEADHISANAITADKIHAGAIDGKLITGARIRTAASGARVELNSEGLKAYRSNGAVVLNTDTSDGSIDMLGTLTTSSGQSDSVYSVRVGDKAVTATGYGAVPGVAFLGTGSSGYREGSVFAEKESVNLSSPTLASKPGSVLKAGSTGIFGYTNGRGPASSGGDDLALLNNGQWNIGRTGGSGWSAWGSGTSARFGSSDGTAPYMQLKRGSADVGYAELTAGARPLYLAGEDAFVDANGGDLYIRRRNSAGTKTWPYMRFDSEGIHLRPKDSRSITMGNVIGNNLSDPVLTVVVGDGGEIGVYGSTRRIKDQIETVDSTTYEDNLLSVPVSSWIAKRDIQRSQELAEFRAANPMCPTPERLAGAPDVPQRNMGMIAEDMHESGMTNLVGYDNYGRPQTIIRESVGMMLIPIIKRLRDRVDALETKLGETA